jgi:hypothetical protein
MNKTVNKVKMMKPNLVEIKVTDIDWDTDGQVVDLPNEVIYDLDLNSLEEGITLDEVKEIYEEQVGDALTRDYDWCVNGYCIEVNKL